jgi:hypothetical protein
MHNYCKDVKIEIPQILKQLIFYKGYCLNLCIIASSIQASPDIVLPSYHHPDLALTEICTTMFTLKYPRYNANTASCNLPVFGDRSVPVSVK